MTLSAEEFIRRFLLHVLPAAFQRIRYYGFLANRYRAQKLAHCRDLLGMPAPEPATSRATSDYRDRYEGLTGSSLWKCPVCHQGRMLMIEILPQSPRQYLTKEMKQRSHSPGRHYNSLQAPRTRKTSHALIISGYFKCLSETQPGINTHRPRPTQRFSPTHF